MQLPSISPRANIGNGVQLRIYPLGDSITSGTESTGSNGYRIGLQRNLAGSKLLFVGSKSGGTMSNNVRPPMDYYFHACSRDRFYRKPIFSLMKNLVERRMGWL